jgi:hypothetical protein
VPLQHSLRLLARGWHVVRREHCKPAEKALCLFTGNGFDR